MRASSAGAWPLILALGTGTAAASDTLDHVVAPGESLWSIAGQDGVYADALLWPLIYEYNRDQIVDPRRIYPSQRLRIPLAVDADARARARRRALEMLATGNVLSP
jgi:hypothetical protein